MENKKYCEFFPHGYVTCSNRCCTYSDCYWYLVHRNNIASMASRTLFYDNYALPLNKKGCVNFYKKALLLKPEAMDRLGIERNLINQIVIPDLSPGLFPTNPTGFIDVKLFANHNATYTIYRFEVYGVASPIAIERYDEYFHLGLARYLQTF